MALIAAVNVGSSSVKAALFSWSRDPKPIERQSFGGADRDAAAASLITWLDRQASDAPLAAIGHRLVHGGPQHRDPIRVTSSLRADLQCLVPFAPNHLPRELAMLDALQAHAPDTPQIACFDTAFHHGMPEVAAHLPIPAQYHARGVRKYGFHGLSYAFLMEELARVAPDEARGRVVLAHLGNGSSLAAVRDNRPLDTTMGFTPIGGIVMSTRSGDLDPGVISYLLRSEPLSADGIEDLLSTASGLRGLSGTTGDMQQLLAREDRDPAARLAVDAYVYSAAKAIGALAVVLNGLDTLVFSGGIGEHASAIRARICGMLEFAGVAIDRGANERHAAVISAPAARVAVRVIPTNEELMIARATWRALEAS